MVIDDGDSELCPWLKHVDHVFDNQKNIIELHLQEENVHL